MTTVWVARLSISRRTARKITQLHGITEIEVRDAIECVRGLSGGGTTTRIEAAEP
ncbi:MAG: hypothetical protein ACRDTH_00960 [Pseudonocardiaceae bacterium]